MLSALHHKGSVRSICCFSSAPSVAAPEPRSRKATLLRPSPCGLLPAQRMPNATEPLGSALPHTAKAIYLDYNGTTPIFPEVAEAMEPFLGECFGNPSSGHVYGRRSKRALDEARGAVATLIGAESPTEVVFTACGTECNNWALAGAALAWREGHPGATPHVVASAVEHPAVTECLKALARLGLLCYTLVPVDAEGRVCLESLRAALRPGSTAVVSLMHANNETGALQPVAEAAAAARAAGALVHCDAAQSIGKVQVDVNELGADLLTVVGHKFGAPKGVAALYIRSGVRLAPFLHGGGQEGGRRAGTESILLAAGLGAAAALARAELAAAGAHMAACRDRLQRGLLAAFPPGATRVNGPSDDAHRLPNTLSIGIRGLSAAAALEALADSLAASSGAACHAPGGGGDDGGARISGVLQAMAVPRENALGTLRLSTGRHTTLEEVDRAVAFILAEAKRQGIATVVK
ncbi:hypothetical protein WJX81_007982 [Elliptochloris bilobata]|uniref:Aminotransferase class V domain-containing protein n=1 Tax=Elliptochloris bilobata TaxID=381761 RepID=A0AAW1R1Z0_9CHLO